MKPAAFRYHSPQGLAEALDLLAEYGDEAKPLAGGQSLVPMLAMRLARFDHQEDSMESDDDSMMSEDGDAMLDCPEEGDDMMDDGDDSMMGDDDAMLDEDTAYPATGTGGLADSGGVSAGLLGLLIALAIATVGGLGYRRVRNRA